MYSLKGSIVNLVLVVACHHRGSPERLKVLVYGYEGSRIMVDGLKLRGRE